MQNLLLAPIILAFFIIILCCSAAKASTYDSNIRALYSDKLIEAVIKQQKDKHQETALSIKVGGRCVHDCVKPIDGDEPAIEISRERNGLPDEYMTLPTSKKNMERYAGR